MSPLTLKGVIGLKKLLQVVTGKAHKFKINCGMTLGAWMRGVIMLLNEKLNQLHHWAHSGHPSNLG